MPGAAPDLKTKQRQHVLPTMDFCPSQQNMELSWKLTRKFLGMGETRVCLLGGFSCVPGFSLTHNPRLSLGLSGSKSKGNRCWGQRGSRRWEREEVGTGRGGSGKRWEQEEEQAFLTVPSECVLQATPGRKARHYTHKESLHLAEGYSQLSEHVGLTDGEVGAVIAIPGVLASAGPHSSQ